jgi:hypothetical protein
MYLAPVVKTKNKKQSEKIREYLYMFLYFCTLSVSIHWMSMRFVSIRFVSIPFVNIIFVKLPFIPH